MVNRQHRQDTPLELHVLQAYTTRRVAPPSKGTVRPVRYPA